MVDLGGVLDPVLGADGVDHAHGVLGGIQTVDNVAVAAAEDLAGEVVRTDSHGAAEIGDALGREHGAHAGAPAPC